MSLFIEFRDRCAERPLSLVGALVASLIAVIFPTDFLELELALVGAIFFAAWHTGRAAQVGVSVRRRGGLAAEQAPSKPLQTGRAPSSNIVATSARRELLTNSHGKADSFTLPQMASRDLADHKPKPPKPTGLPASCGSPSSISVEKTKTDWRKPSVAPVVAAQFVSIGFDNEVLELLAESLPSAESNALLDSIVRGVQEALRPIFPQLEVNGFTQSSLTRGKAFGVAVPDVEIVANVPQGDFELAFKKLQPTSQFDRDPRSAMRWAVRMCTDQLVTAAGFKFRRSAFRVREPKTTLLSPADLGAIPLDFSVNAETPGQNASLVAEACQYWPQTRDLLLLVQRWARDRGISHVAKGHLSPSAWNILVIFFLQTGLPDEGPLLPPLPGSTDAVAWTPKMITTSLGAIFKEFVRFYSSNIDWEVEAVSVRRATRGPPHPRVVPHVVDGAEDPSRTSRVAPTIEDPFDASRNLGALMDAESLTRLQEELSRAEAICARADASLAELLVPWAPTEAQLCPEREPQESLRLRGVERLAEIVAGGPRPSGTIAAAPRATGSGASQRARHNASRLARLAAG